MRANSLCKPRVSRFCCAHSHAYDSRLRAAVYADAVSALEDRIGHPVMSRNIAAGRAIHPDVCGPSALASLVSIFESLYEILGGWLMVAVPAAAVGLAGCPPHQRRQFAVGAAGVLLSVGMLL